MSPARIFAWMVASPALSEMPFRAADIPHVLRVSAAPIITPQSFPGIGHNLNGPCVMRAPSWAKAPLGAYYLYFAHHAGTFIRLAVADDLAGPWRVVGHQPLCLTDTAFAHSAVTWQPEKGPAITEPAHIASPDVHVDDTHQQVFMLFHGLHRDGRQTTQLAASDDGLSFEMMPCGDLAPPYLRMCRTDLGYIGISWGGALVTAPSLKGPFETGPTLLTRPNGPGLIPRHPALVWRGGFLHCFYSLIGDCPERLWHVSVQPASRPADWSVGTPRIVLEPTHAWEGAHLPKVASRIGTADEIEHALRDPFIVGDHLFYAAGGEHCIAHARIEWRQPTA